MSYPYKFRTLLAILRPRARQRIYTAKRIRRKTHHGLLSVGLKLHCLDGGPQFAGIIRLLGGEENVINANLYRRKVEESICWVLPPVGNVEAAIMLIEALEEATESMIFHNPNVQIQVCSPGQLEPENAALLTIGFCLGSDQLRGFFLKDLETTFSDVAKYSYGRRIVLYDARGEFDRQFSWWRGEGMHLAVDPILPFKNRERTDVLVATSPHDLRNINLLATLLVHEQYDGYWKHLGQEFMIQMLELLDRHMLLDILEAPWVRTQDPESANDVDFADALNILMTYAFEDAKRLQSKPWQIFPNKKEPSILVEMRELLTHFRAEILKRSHQLAAYRRPT